MFRKKQIFRNRTEEKYTPAEIFSECVFAVSQKMELDTYFAVRLLMTPVVVSYCFASANTAAIPEHRNKWGGCEMMSRTRLLTYSPVKVGYNCCQGDHNQPYSFAVVTPLNQSVRIF